jgi:hypothetical protein
VGKLIVGEFARDSTLAACEEQLEFSFLCIETKFIGAEITSRNTELIAAPPSEQ